MKERGEENLQLLPWVFATRWVHYLVVVVVVMNGVCPVLFCGHIPTSCKYIAKTRLPVVAMFLVRQVPGYLPQREVPYSVLLRHPWIHRWGG